MADYWQGFLAPRSWTVSMTTLAARRRFMGPASQNILFWAASIGLSCPIVPTPPVHSALRSQPSQQPPTGSLASNFVDVFDVRESSGSDELGFNSTLGLGSSATRLLNPTVINHFFF